MALDLFFKNHAPQLDRWWTQWGIDMAHLAARWGTSLQAKRIHRADGMPGGWTVTGPYQAVSAFKDMAASAAEHIGCKLGYEQRWNFWLDHIQGDHVDRRTPKQRRDDDRLQIVTKGDGTKEAYRGRQRIG